MYKVERNRCDCHPETCGCKPWKIVDQNNAYHSTHEDKSVADSTAAIMNSREVKQTLVGTVLALSREADKYHGDRSLRDILDHGIGEMKETLDEVEIFLGDLPGPAGADGVIGEAIDTILCLLDLIYKFNPTFTEAQMVEIAESKGAKWIRQIKAKAETDPGPPWNV
jgi:hypothetical protein